MTILLVLMLCSSIALGLKVTPEMLLPMKEFNEFCGYDSCPIPLSDTGINVHIVPHTHYELGFDRTFAEHYTGKDSRFAPTKVNMKQTLDSVVTELWMQPHRRFALSDIPYFFHWWSQRDDTVRQMAYTLIRQGRLMFVGGGWSMADEATTDYHAIIDSHTFSLRKINATFWKCGRPLVAWQSDVMGHSREFASLAAQMGYDGLFINPISFDDELARMRRWALEMLWRGSDDLGPRSDIYTHKLFDGYWSPPGFCFSSLCEDPLIIKSDSTLSNVEERVKQFMDSIYNRQAPNYNTSHVMVMMGHIKGYFDAPMWFGNIDNLINAVNARAVFGKQKMYLFYSTPACYAKAVHDTNIQLETKQDDFFPVAYDKDSYLTGLYTSCPSIKYMARIAMVYLQMCKQMRVLAELGSHYDKLFEELNWIVGAFQDHSIITGALRDTVKSYYVGKHYKAVQRSTILLREAWNKLRKCPSETIYYRCSFNVSRCHFLVGDTYFVQIYNPLAWPVTMPVRFPTHCFEYGFHVFDPKGRMLKSATIVIPYPVLNIHNRMNASNCEVVFIAEDLPPIGFRSYFIQRILPERGQPKTKRESAKDREVKQNVTIHKSDKQNRTIHRNVKIDVTDKIKLRKKTTDKRKVQVNKLQAGKTKVKRDANDEWKVKRNSTNDRNVKSEITKANKVTIEAKVKGTYKLEMNDRINHVKENNRSVKHEANDERKLKHDGNHKLMTTEERIITTEGNNKRSFKLETSKEINHVKANNGSSKTDTKYKKEVIPETINENYNRENIKMSIATPDKVKPERGRGNQRKIKQEMTNERESVTDRPKRTLIKQIRKPNKKYLIRQTSPQLDDQTLLDDVDYDETSTVDPMLDKANVSMLLESDRDEIKLQELSETDDFEARKAKQPDLEATETKQPDLEARKTIQSDLDARKTVEPDLETLKTVEPDLESLKTVEPDLETLKTIEPELNKASTSTTMATETQVVTSSSPLFQHTEIETVDDDGSDLEPQHWNKVMTSGKKDFDDILRSIMHPIRTSTAKYIDSQTTTDTDGYQTNATEKPIQQNFNETRRTEISNQSKKIEMEGITPDEDVMHHIAQSVIEDIKITTEGELEEISTSLPTEAPVKVATEVVTEAMKKEISTSLLTEAPVKVATEAVTEAMKNNTSEATAKTTTEKVIIETKKKQHQEELEKHVNRKMFDVGNVNNTYIANKYIRVTIDPVTSKISAVTLSNGVNMNLDIQFYFYASDDPDALGKTGFKKPGAYLFRAMENTAIPILDFIDVQVYKTEVVEEAHFVYSEWTSFVIRVYDESPVIEVEWLVGPIPVADKLGKEVFIRYMTDLVHDGVFYTDSNGRQTIKRVRNLRPQFEPLNLDQVAGNLYPVTSWISIQDPSSRVCLSVFTDRAQGGASLADGELDLMLHRRILTDDSGVGTFVNDTENGTGAVVRGKHYLYISKIDYKPYRIFEKKFAKELHMGPQMLVSRPDPYGANAKTVWSKSNNDVSFLNTKLPIGIHILTIESWNDDTLLLRLENYLEKSDNLRNPTKTVFIRELFTNIYISNVKETTLAANVWLEEHKPMLWEKKEFFVKNFNGLYGVDKEPEFLTDEKPVTFENVYLDKGITLAPQQIRTFVCWFDYVDI